VFTYSDFIWSLSCKLWTRISYFVVTSFICWEYSDLVVTIVLSMLYSFRWYSSSWRCKCYNLCSRSALFLLNSLSLRKFYLSCYFSRCSSSEVLWRCSSAAYWANFLSCSKVRRKSLIWVSWDSRPSFNYSCIFFIRVWSSTLSRSTYLSLSSSSRVSRSFSIFNSFSRSSQIISYSSWVTLACVRS